MRDFFRKNKIYIIAITILLLYLAIFYFVALGVNKENSKYASIIVDGVNIWEYKERNWSVLSEDEVTDDKNVYDLYSSFEYYGDYTVKVNNQKLYAFDSKYNSLQYDGSVLAINSNYNINVNFFGYSSANENDKNILASVVNNNFSNDIRKISLDVNSDKEEEYFYVIDYYNDGEIFFSEIYYYDGKLREVIKNEGSRYLIYDIEYILDIDNNGDYEIIVSSSYFNVVSYKIYKLDGKDFILFLE